MPIGKVYQALTPLGIGVQRDNTQYATGARWFDCNWVRWIETNVQPIGGWVELHDFSADGYSGAIRDIFTWRDTLKSPWAVYGSNDGIRVVNYRPDETLTYDPTPLDLAFDTTPTSGYGSGFYGYGRYSQSDNPVDPDLEAMWSFDNFGAVLLAVNSQDGRLLEYDPGVPTAAAAAVSGAPTSNTLVIVTDEGFCMVMGGQGNPAQVKWASQGNFTDWTPTELNSAGGFDLNTNGAILAAKKVQGGIIVWTDTDTHLIEYVGAPDYYARRRVSTNAGIIGKNAVVDVPMGVVWIDNDNMWIFDGNISKFQCEVSNFIFEDGNLSQPSRVFAGHNAVFDESWFFFPALGVSTPNRYIFYSYSDTPYWALGRLSRDAWHQPVWQQRPIAAASRIIYTHESGVLAAGSTRVGSIYVESGPIEIGQGERVAHVDRIIQDTTGLNPDTTSPDDYTITFKIKQAPGQTERTVGPITLNATKGYTTTRFRARQFKVRLDGTDDVIWRTGKMRLRIKPGGRR